MTDGPSDLPRSAYACGVVPSVLLLCGADVPGVVVSGEFEVEPEAVAPVLLELELEPR